MAIVERYFNPDLGTGSNNGTSEANAWQTWSQMQTDHVAGERVNAKNPASAYDPAGIIAFATSGTDLLFSGIRGYGSTIGDGVKFVMNITSNGYMNGTGESCHYQDLSITSNYQHQSTFGLSGDLSYIVDCIVIQSSTATSGGGEALNLSDSSANNCYVESNIVDSSGGIALWLGNSQASNMEIVAASIAVNMDENFTTNTLTNSLIYEKGAAGQTGVQISNFANGKGGLITGCTVDGFVNLIDFLAMEDVTAGNHIKITNCLLSNGVTGIGNTDVASKNFGVVVDGVAFYNISGSDTELGNNPIYNSIAVLVDPYTDASNDDYSLNSAATGGALLRATRTFAAGSTANFFDIGAMQHECTGGSGGLSQLIGQGGLIK